jgi:hypothetical protein
MAHMEISSLFHLVSGGEPPVANALIGSGVYIQELDYQWIEGVRKQCPKVSAREELEFQRPYTGSFTIPRTLQMSFGM